ncbi:1277_t:CDS:1 [Funneliformis mosseae]|uniref:Phosphatidylglycerol/phosphatidylinositol transfer protein n=1 Tax=Funneliformis mosseae TaxID=27381 RepID=A0A9N9A248_FUNMO|nr:1277_t:CDS:1 [Funneliformis mosseae]
MVNAIPHKLLKRADYYSCPQDLFLLRGSFTISEQKVIATVTGTLKNDITEQTKLVVAFGDSNVAALAEPIVFDACTGSGCPIKAGDAINQKVEFKLPDQLPKSYNTVFSMANSESDILGCFDFPYSF